MEQKLVEYKGVYCREDNGNDRSMIKDCLNHYTHFNLNEDSVVMDMGTHVGGFAVMCKNAGVKQYVGFEADRDNFQILQKNTQGAENFVLNSGAISASKDDTLVFYQNESKSSKCSGTVAPATNRSKGQRKVRNEVKNFNIFEMFEKYQPTHVKVDIEGAEYDWMEQSEGKIPDCIEEISFELHREDGVKLFEEKYLPKFLENYEIINVAPCDGFHNKESEVKKMEKLNFEYRGTLFGVDIFFRRKDLV